MQDLKFDFSWFIPAIVKYRTFLGEVFVASFVLQLFALLTPLFTQVVIDKVLVHKGFTTLHVLAIGMIALAIFDAIARRPPHLSVFAYHQSDRRRAGRSIVSPHLGASLWPILKRSRVGDTVARVRELEHIRQFLTSHSVTVVLDVIFTVVFLVVMWFYSPIAHVGRHGVPAALCLVVDRHYTDDPRRLHEKFNRGAENQSFSRGSDQRHPDGQGDGGRAAAVA